jgi:3-deoxy-D-manno-octulosonic-acid transferase
VSAPALTVYRLLLGLAEPLAPLILRQRAIRGKEDPNRLRERLGYPSRTRQKGPMVWMHGASVGETLSLLPLIERLHGGRPDLNLIVTSGTATSASLLARRLPGDVPHQYAPIDAPGATRRFLDYWRPDVAVFAESEIWPNLLLGAKARGAKVALVSARITEKTADGWRRYPKSAAEAFGAFDLTLPQDDASARRLEDLGARVDGRLNLKLAGDPLPADPAAIDAVRAAANGRPILLAASTHSGEDEMVLDAYNQADPDRKSLLVIVPRHTERGLGLANMARTRGFRATLRSRGESPADGEVHIADTLGELGLWFRVAAAAYVGGGMSKRVGGHNPLEAARLGCPAISGPQVRNWAEVYAALQALNGVTLVNTSADLGRAFAWALSDPQAAKAQAARARGLVDGQAAAMEAGWALIAPLLPPAPVEPAA